MSLVTRFAAAALIALGPSLPAAAEDGTLTISVTFGPNAEVPDPRVGYNGWMSNQTGVTETLMGIDYDLALYPRLAESIEQTAPTTWRVTLREGLSFHDGSPVTAQSVVDAIAPISDPEHAAHNARLAGLLDLADLSAEGARDVIFETRSADAAFPFTLSAPGVAILGAASDAFPINATGPYIFREAVPDQLYRVEGDPDYRLGEPGFEEVRVVAAQDPATAALAFEAGEVDMVINYPETDFARIQTTGAEGFSAPTSRLYFYAMNARSGPLSDPLIRRAVSYAIDREAIVEAVLSGVGGVPAETLYPAASTWATEPGFTYDPDRAEALLSEAGAVKEGGVWTLDGDPLEIEIVTYASRAPLPPTAELTQAFLQAIGVSSSVRVNEYGASRDLLSAGDADMFLQAWVTLPQGDPSAILELLLASEGSSNAGRYANPTLDGLLQDGRTTFEMPERQEIYREIQAIVAEDAPVIPVFHVSQVVVARPGLTGYAVHPSENYWITHETRFAE